jgi:putative ABC transport system permease protein
MIGVALKMLLGDKLKYLALVAGLAFAALLVTQQASIFLGYTLRTGAWIRDTGAADLWVMDPQLVFTEDNKPMLERALYQVRGVDGVDWAVPMYKGWLTVRLPDGTRVTSRLIGLDDASLVGGPPEMVSGRLEDLRRDRAVIIHADQASDGLLLKRGLEGEGPRPLRIGDTLGVRDHGLEVVGTFRSAPEFFWDPLVYTTYSRALQVAPPDRRMTGYVLVKCKPGTDVQTVAQRIEERTGLEARTSAEFEDVTMWFVLVKTGILVNFGFTILLGFVVGALAAGQTFYMFVLDNLRHYAALKAMGATSGTLALMVGAQLMVAAFVGYGVGLGAACLTTLAPASSGLAFEMPWQVPALGFAAIMVCAGIAGGIALLRVLRVDPALVFKS